MSEDGPKKTTFDSDECQELLYLFDAIMSIAGLYKPPITNNDQLLAYKKLQKAGEFYAPLMNDEKGGQKMVRKRFLEPSDRHDLFEHIKKINPNIEMIDAASQGLLNAIDEKLCDIHKQIWDDIVTVSFVGGAGSGKSSLMSRLLRSPLPGFVAVEVNEPGHFIRYVQHKGKQI